MLASLITSKERAPLQQLRLAPSLECPEGKVQEPLFEDDEILLERFILLYISYYQQI